MKKRIVVDYQYNAIDFNEELSAVVTVTLSSDDRETNGQIFDFESILSLLSKNSKLSIGPVPFNLWCVGLTLVSCLPRWRRICCFRIVEYAAYQYLFTNQYQR